MKVRKKSSAGESKVPAVVVDGERWDALFEPEDITTVGDLLREVERQLNERGRTVRALTVDGNPLPAGNPGSVFTRQMSTAPEVDVIAESAHDAAARDVNAVLTLLPDLRESVAHLAELLRVDPFAQELVALEAAVEGWSVVLRRLDRAVRLLGEDPEQLVVDGCSVAEHREKLDGALAQVAQLLEKGEVFQLAEVLSSQLVPATEFEEKLARHLAALVD